MEYVVLTIVITLGLCASFMPIVMQLYASITRDGIINKTYENITRDAPVYTTTGINYYKYIDVLTEY